MTTPARSKVALPPNARMRWSVVDRLVESLRPKTILEIGCGQGAFGSRLATVAEYLAVEPDATSFEMARARIEAAGGSIINGTAEVVAADRSFDLVCAFEVLEHLEDDVTALRRWQTYLADHGALMLSVPAFQDRFNAWDTHVGHYRRYSPREMTETLRKAGLVAEELVVYGWPLGYALEKVRGSVAARRGAAAEDEVSDEMMRERTAGSGRILQPKALAGKALSAATIPFTWLQRTRPKAGTGLVAVARRPA
jgi:SAM-dependent methyltransferase